MKTTIRDTDILRTIRPLDVVAYLRTSGWQLDREVEGRYSRWLRPAPEHETFEIETPLSSDLRDYPSRIADVLTTLEAAEARPQQEILEDLLTPAADIVRIRIAGPDSRDGSLPFQDAVELVDHTRDLLLAAACAAIQPRPYFETRKPSEATDFLRRLRMGQTERGSFVVTIQCRVPPLLDERLAVVGEVHEEDLPFERRVTQTLAVGLDNMQRAARRAATSGQLDAFRDAVPFGLSANLCSAVAGLVGSREDQSVGVAFSWARTRPAPADLPSQIRFTADSIPIIGEAGRVLKEHSPREEFELEGLISKVDKPDPASHDRGTFTIGGIVDGRQRRVSVELLGDDYRRALEAVRNGLLVRCSGTLVKERRSFELRQPRDFIVITEP